MFTWEKKGESPTGEEKRAAKTEYTAKGPSFAEE